MGNFLDQLEAYRREQENRRVDEDDKQKIDRSSDRDDPSSKVKTSASSPNVSASAGAAPISTASTASTAIPASTRTNKGSAESSKDGSSVPMFRPNRSAFPTPPPPSASSSSNNTTAPQLPSSQDSVNKDNEGDDNVSSCTDTDTLPAVDTEEEDIEKDKDAEKIACSSSKDDDEQEKAKKKAWEAEWKKKLEAMKKEKHKGKQKKRDSGETAASTEASNAVTEANDASNDSSTSVSASSTTRKQTTPEQPHAKKRKLESEERPAKRAAKDAAEKKPSEAFARSRSNSASSKSNEKDDAKLGSLPPPPPKKPDATATEETEKAEKIEKVEEASADVQQKDEPYKKEDSTPPAAEAEAKVEEDRKKLMRIKTREMLKTLMKHGSIIYQPLCTCKVPGTSFTVIQHPPSCQALDSVDDKLVSCNGKVTASEIIRPATRIPFMALCDLHRRRMHHHQCCPSCGIFCSQGKFLQCRKEAKWKHWFHLKCFNSDRTGEPLCPHCGEKSEQHEVVLRLKALEASVAERILGESGDRVVQEVGVAATTTSSSNAEAASSSSSANQLVPTANPPQRAKMTFEKYLKSGTKSTASSSNGFLTKCEEKSYSKFDIDASLVVNVKKSDGTEFKFRHMPLGLPADIMSSVSNMIDKKSRQVRGGSRNLLKVAKDGDFEKVMFMLIDGLDPNVAQDDGPKGEKKVALFGAIEAQSMPIVHLLVEAGANVNAADSSLHTVLMEAVLKNNLDVVHYLIKAGADVNGRRDDGMNALQIAAQNGHNDVVEFLLRKCGMDPNTKDEGGWTCIVWAADNGHVETAQLLLQLGADPNVQDNEENTALHWSAFSGSQDIAALLLDAGCDVESTNDKGDRPLHLAARQDQYDCVVLFLSRGASINVMNNNNETPLACARDQNSTVWMALRVNSQLKSASSVASRAVEKMVHRDISLGRENQAVSAINSIDEHPAPLDFLYITESVETSPLPINRTVTSLQNCSCPEDCTTLSCLCARNSLRCWYDREGRLTKDFNYTEPPLIFECNRGCRCWKTCSNRVVQHGQSARIQIYKTKGRGWGVRASLDILQGSFICEYVGELISDSEADNREDDSYLFDLDNKDGDTYCIDARRYGNVARFINHRCEPNIIPVKVFVDHQDLRFPRICFFATTDIKAGEELGFDYGEKFWIIKYKDFLCACGSPKCKYSKAMIHQTLANYNHSQEDG